MPQVVAIFRALIITGFAVAVLGSVVDYVVPGLLPQVLDQAYDTYISQDPSLVFVIIGGGLALILFPIAIVATIGLLLLKRWSRGLAMLSTVLAMVTYPVLGPMVYSGWARMLIESAMIMWGAALAMAYFSELRVHFARRPS